MKFFEQFSIGDRVEVHGQTHALIFTPGLEATPGDRGTVLDKQKIDWLDPVSHYVLELDYPCSNLTSTISGRYLRRLRPEEEINLKHKNIGLHTIVTMWITESSSPHAEPTASGILLPDLDHPPIRRELRGTVIEKCAGSRRNEPDKYLVAWESEEAPRWHRETEIQPAFGPEPVYAP